jgi:radical SAM superfamily enzyme
MMERDPHSAYQHAEQVRQRYQTEILAKANVVGIGVGLRSRGGAITDEVVIVVMVSKKVRFADLSIEDLVPAELDGVPVDVQEVGEIGLHG